MSPLPFLRSLLYLGTVGTGSLNEVSSVATPAILISPPTSMASGIRGPALLLRCPLAQKEKGRELLSQATEISGTIYPWKLMSLHP